MPITPIRGRAPARAGRRSRGGRRAALAAVAVLAAACSSVQVRYPDGRTEYQSRDEFAAYVETVFRYQNRVVNDLILATSLGAVEASEDAALVRAEREMARACQPLIETVAAELEGRRVGLLQQLTLPSAVPACEVASRRLELLLDPI